MFPYPIQLSRPDIAPYRSGNCGIPYVWTFEGPTAGPHVWINALTHGDEVCGAFALDHLLRRDVRPRCGRLTLSFANVAAFEASSEGHPLGVRFVDEDLNRVWGALEDGRRSIELDRARALRPIANEADYLVDLHAMTHPTEPLAIVGTVDDIPKLEQGIALARRIGEPRLLLADRGHTAGVRLRDYGSFADAASHRTALVVECGGWWEARSVTFALEYVGHVLSCFDMADPAQFGLPTREHARPFRLIRSTETVTIETTDFRFVQPFKGDEIIAEAGTLIAFDGDREVRTPFADCALLMPLLDPRPGATAVRFGHVAELG